MMDVEDTNPQPMESSPGEPWDDLSSQGDQSVIMDCSNLESAPIIRQDMEDDDWVDEVEVENRRKRQRDSTSSSVASATSSKVATFDVYL